LKDTCLFQEFTLAASSVGAPGMQPHPLAKIFWAKLKLNSGKSDEIWVKPQV